MSLFSWPPKFGNFSGLPSTPLSILWTNGPQNGYSVLANFFKFLEVEGLAEKYFSMLGWFFLFIPMLSIFLQNPFIFFQKLKNCEDPAKDWDILSMVWGTQAKSV